MGTDDSENGSTSSATTRSTSMSTAGIPTGGAASISRASEKHISCWRRLHAKANHAVDTFFYHLGYGVASHPKLTLLISMVLVLVCCWGFKHFEYVSDADDLWVPKDNLSKRQQIIAVSAFRGSGDYAVVIMESPSGEDSVLTKESMDAMWELDEKVLSMEVNGFEYSDLCVLAVDGVNCAQPFRGVTRFWGDSFETYEASVFNDSDVLAAINADRFPDGQEVALEPIFGNSVAFDETGNVVGARAMMQIYNLHKEMRELAADGADVKGWQGEFEKLMEEAAISFHDIFNVKYLTGRSLSDALNESLSGELFLFVITYIIMIIFVMVALGRCCSGPVRCRSWLGLGGVMTVVAAGLAAYGFCSGLGVPFTILAKILPFILIGIGVDDMFVILAAFDHTDTDLPVVQRVALGLKRCGMSVTYTSLTNVSAFMLGSTSSLPVVEYFCIYAGIAILFDFFLQVTAFVALLTIDANRQKAGRMDWWCCCESQMFLEEERVRRGVTLPAEDIKDDNGGWPDDDVLSTTVQLRGVGRFMKTTYTPFILSCTGKVLVLVGATTLLLAGIYGVNKATQGFDILDLAPDDHFSRDFTEVARVYELEVDTQYLELGIVTLGLDYTDVSVQAQMQDTDALMKEQTHGAGPITSWITSFAEWAENSTIYSLHANTFQDYPVYDDRETFYTALTAFMEDGENARFLSDIRYDDNGVIVISRSKLYLVDLVDTASNIDALQDTREVVAQSTLDPEPFGYSEIFVFTEQFLVMYRELISNFALALIAVGVLSVFILGNLAIVALVCVTVVIIDIELLGFVYYWGLEVNSITVIELIMAVGLVVDYIVHVVHYFLHQDPNMSKNLRIAYTLGEIGPSVMVGAATTFLGIMPLAFANNVIFRVFFKMFLVIISFGFFHGVVFVPVVLSIMPDCLVSPRSSASPRISNRKAVHPTNGP